MIVVPVIFFSLITGAASISPSMLGRVGIKTLLFYVFTTLVAVVIGIGVAAFFQPGADIVIAGESGAAGKAAASPPMSQILLNIIPTNPIEALAKGDVLPVIFFALVCGIALSILRESSDDRLATQGNALFNACAAFAEVIYKVVGGIMQYAPIGVFVLIAIVFAEQGPKVIGSLLHVTMSVYIALALHLLFCYGGLMALNGLSFLRFLKGANDAMITAFVTRSSGATLPVSMKISENNLGVPREICAFALPIGSTINMNGTAIYIAVCAMFIANAIGAPLNYGQLVTVMTTATLAAVGTAGVPGSGVLMLIMALESVGLKLEDGSAVAAAYALVLGIDALLDMGRTSMNTTGDIVAAVLVSKSEKALDMDCWQEGKGLGRASKR